MSHRIQILLIYGISVWLLLANAVHTSAQYAPFYGANMIMVGTSFADKEARAVISDVLTKESIPHSFNQGAVTFQVFEKYPATNKEFMYDCYLTVQAGLVKLTGRLRNAATVATTKHEQPETEVVPIVYTKDKTSPQRLGFVYIDQLAKKLQSALNGVIIYKN